MKKTFAATIAFLFTCFAFAQDNSGANLPVTSVSLFSSGVGYFEHTGTVKDAAIVSLVFDASAVNDILKSLVVHDAGTSTPSVSYASGDTLYKTLRGLSVDLSGNPGVADLLGSLRGAEIRIDGAKKTVGRIVGVERKTGTDGAAGKDFLSVSTGDGIQVFDIAEISGFSFTDKKLSADLGKALDLISSSRNESSRLLSVNLPGKGPRPVTLGYVAPVPVWKATYRLDLSGKSPVLQGWAIVDNTGEMDWIDVRLSLVTGKPVSFIQNLYEPFYFQRPVLPLSIAGAADAAVYGSGYDEYAEADMAMEMPMAAPSMAKSATGGTTLFRTQSEEANGPVFGVGNETATGGSSGDFFEYTMAKPVSIPRQQSAMLPLVESPLSGEKVSVYSSGAAHPMLCVWLVNSSGMKLPAGPVTVFDGGNYSGDALLEFFPENEKRLVAFGEDLAVDGSVAESSSLSSTAITASKGVLTIIRKTVYAKAYRFRNADTRPRTLLVEHPVTHNASLVSPSAYEERTDSAYRFRVNLPAKGEVTLEVREEKPDRKTISLLGLDAQTLLYYSTAGEVPANVRSALEKAVALRKKADDASARVESLVGRKNELIGDQDRIRNNLEAAGNETQQGKEYLKKLAQADGEIESLSNEIAAARKNLEDALGQYRNYLSGLELQ